MTVNHVLNRVFALNKTLNKKLTIQDAHLYDICSNYRECCTGNRTKTLMLSKCSMVNVTNNPSMEHSYPQTKA